MSDHDHDQGLREHAELAEWDAAYVLGALTAADRRIFEAHLATCERCRAAVAELAAMPGLLSRIGADAAEPDAAEPDADAVPSAAVPTAPSTVPPREDEPAPPIDLLERTIRRDDARRRSRRIRVAVLGAVAAAVLALAVAVPMLLSRPAAPDVTLALAPTGASTMTAEVGLESVAWGTRITMDCDYPEGSAWGDEDGPWAYALQVTDVDGGTSQVSTWTATAGREMTLSAGTALPLGRIASVEVLTGAGDAILAAAVGED